MHLQSRHLHIDKDNLAVITNPIAEEIAIVSAPEDRILTMTLDEARWLREALDQQIESIDTASRRSVVAADNRSRAKKSRGAK